MADIPAPIHTSANYIDEAAERNAEPPRGHLGISQIGDKCERRLWLLFRWAIRQHFPGRIIRLFRRGHMEEALLIRALEDAGMKVRAVDEGGKQMKVRFGKSFEGSMDGIIESGVPESPKTPHLFEAKTASLKRFEQLLELQSIQQWEFKYYCQVQLYMHGRGLTRCYFVVVCKDDDRLYIERIKYDPKFSDRFIRKGHRITMSERLPEPCSTDPDSWECRFCFAKDFCYGSGIAREVNCRTCAHSTHTDSGLWKCERWGDYIPEDFQHKGCESHVMHPDLVPFKFVRGEANCAVYLVPQKHGCAQEVRNGESGKPSRKLIDEFVALMETFNDA